MLETLLNTSAERGAGGRHLRYLARPGCACRRKSEENSEIVTMAFAVGVATIQFTNYMDLEYLLHT